MIDSGLFMISNIVEDYTQVDMSQEFPCNICNFLVLIVEFNGITIKVLAISFAQFHVVYTDAIVGERFTMNITDGLADLKEFLVLLNGLLVFPKIVKENTRRIVCTALISRFSCTLASKS
jgi:hypothetical protein